MTALAGAGTLGGTGRRGRGEDVGDAAGDDAEDRGGGRAGGTVYRVLVASGMQAASTRMSRGRVAILMYHGLHAGDIDPRVNFDGLYIHVDAFARQMEYPWSGES